MSARAGLRGKADVQRRIMNVARRFPDRVGQSVYRRAEAVMTRSKDEFVPVDLGTLRGTGHVTRAERAGRIVRVALVYGGPAAAYAAAVHEHPSARSPSSWRGRIVRFSPAGRGPKYLERPLMEALSTMPQELAAELSLETVA